MRSRFPLLESVPSIQALVEDPQYAQVRAQFESYPDHQVPDVSVRADAAPGPHGPVPVRVYNDGGGNGSRPCLVWMHGGAFMMGNLDMPEADWTSFFNLNYLGGPLSKADGYAFPALADLRGLCPTLVLNAEYDDLRSSGQAFGAALAAAGVDVRQVMVTSMLHGFLNLPASIGPVGAALELMAETLRVPAAITA